MLGVTASATCRHAGMLCRRSVAGSSAALYMIRRQMGDIEAGAGFSSATDWLESSCVCGTGSWSRYADRANARRLTRAEQLRSQSIHGARADKYTLPCTECTFRNYTCSLFCKLNLARQWQRGRRVLYSPNTIQPVPCV